MLIISGFVAVKETNVGVPGLIARVLGVDAGMPSDQIREAIIGGSPALRDKVRALGSRMTNAQGAFRVELSDASLATPPEGRLTPPNLMLALLAPDEPGVSPEARLLFVSSEVRDRAAEIEEYSVLLPSSVLEKAGVPLPRDPSNATVGPMRATQKLRQALNERLALEKETKTLAAARVNAMKEEVRNVDFEIEKRLIEWLTGFTAEDAERFSIVPPGASSDATVLKTVRRSIQNVVNQKPPQTGYIVISEQVAQRFKDNNGNFRTDIAPEEIEPFLYQGEERDARPTYLQRDIPAATPPAQNDPFKNPSGGLHGTASNGDGPQPTPSGNGSFSLPALVGKLMGSAMPPEEATLFKFAKRPDSNDVQDAIAGLTLKSGPADLPTYYDFYEQQIAFDHVWQQAIDEGIIESGKALGRTLLELGGDPVGALQTVNDPIRALREETSLVAKVAAALSATGIAMRPVNTDLISGEENDGRVPIRPGVIRNPIVDGVVAPPPTHVSDGWRPKEPHELLDELNDLLSERYKFEIFAPGSTNFGLRITYRQKWTPKRHEAGRLVKTITLAPNEIRKLTTKRVVKKERSVKEMEANQRIRKSESDQTMRDEAEIVRRAQEKTNFGLSAQGSYDFLIAGGDSTTTFNRDAEASSQETKKAFRESVLKAAQELKDERKIEVETKTTVETEETQTIELNNPNNELTCTYLFYEIQRCFQVAESIHKLTPVVMVAMEVPNPSRKAIDRILIAHSWIINRVLLDDRYRPALDYLCTKVVGDELALRDLQANMLKLSALVDKLQTLHRETTELMKARENALRKAIEVRADKISSENTEGWGEKALEAVVGSGDEEDLEAARVREDLAKDAYERAVREEKELRMRLDSEIAALNAASADYASAHAQHANHLLEVAALRVHFKENVLFYMQAIWSYTFRDQLYFELAKKKVPKLKVLHKTYAVAVPASPPLGVVPKPGEVALQVTAKVELDPNVQPDDFNTLEEIAKVGQPIGFFGNFAIFPLKASNPLTDFMMVPYIDTALGLHDPDQMGAWTPEDFAAHARALIERNRNHLSPAELEVMKNELRAQYKRIVSNLRPEHDEIVVPTDSLFIEALPGSHPLLEDFKLAHRLLDVKKVQAETRQIELENARRAARILADQLGDPDVDKKIIVEGANNGIVIPQPDA